MKTITMEDALVGIRLNVLNKRLTYMSRIGAPEIVLAPIRKKIKKVQERKEAIGGLANQPHSILSEEIATIEQSNQFGRTRKDARSTPMYLNSIYKLTTVDGSIYYYDQFESSIVSEEDVHACGFSLTFHSLNFIPGAVVF